LLDFLIKSFNKKLIVSCQAERDDPFNKPEYLAMFAKAAELGGACAVRVEGIQNIKTIKARINIPVIGIIKGKFHDNYLLLTPDFDDIENLIKCKCDLIAIDATKRVRPNGYTGFNFLNEVKKRYDIPIIADISNYNEGITAAGLGADFIATTLSGYTPDSIDHIDVDNPDYDLISTLSSSLNIPIIAEGRIRTPSDAIKAIEFGAYSVVVGTTITSPKIITQMFCSALDTLKSNKSLLEED
jgi:N-acylglucosamine-6-phosphate 2-epimerase